MHQDSIEGNPRSNKLGANRLVSLRELGFLEGAIVETIVSTYNSNGEPNAAPMGVMIKTEGAVQMKPYITTTTYQNMNSTRCAVVNVTADPELFYITAFKNDMPDSKLPAALFGKAKKVNAPRLIMADSHIEVKIEDLKTLDDEKAHVMCEVQFIKASKQISQAYCRAKSAVIEAIIHATRLESFLKRGDEKKEQIMDLLERFRICCDVVNHVAPNSNYSNLMSNLTTKIEEWRRENESPS